MVLFVYSFLFVYLLKIIKFLFQQLKLQMKNKELDSLDHVSFFPKQVLEFYIALALETCYFSYLNPIKN